MKIAILGWGSLLWDASPEFDRWHDPWQHDGPTLKMEFSRISRSRIGALTLVIDENHGAQTTVAWCFSIRHNVGDAVRDLYSREGTTLDNIGRIEVAAEASVPQRRAAADPVSAWARVKRLDVVLWTSLGSNFEEKTGQPFSLEAAVSYLNTLRPEGKAKAAEYVRRAPDFVKTPLRSLLEREPRC